MGCMKGYFPGDNINASEVQEIEIIMIDPENDVGEYNTSTGALIQENLTMPDFDILNASITTGPLNYTMVLHIKGNFNISGLQYQSALCYEITLKFEYHWANIVYPDQIGYARCQPYRFDVFHFLGGAIENATIQELDNSTGTLNVTFPRAWIPDEGNPALHVPITNFWLFAQAYHRPGSDSFPQFWDTLSNAVEQEPEDPEDPEDPGDSGGDNPKILGYSQLFLVASVFISIALISKRLKGE
ncbi:MAG: hypothetical protein ACTSUE_00705 [Promethearchaeota archaeon]